MKGAKIKTYPSVSVASKKTRISISHISPRARGIELSAGGFVWRYGKAVKIDIKPMIELIELRKKRNKEVFGEKVTHTR